MDHDGCWLTASQPSQDYDHSPDLEHNIVQGHLNHLDISQNFTTFDSSITGTEDQKVVIL